MKESIILKKEQGVNLCKPFHIMYCNDKKEPILCRSFVKKRLGKLPEKIRVSISSDIHEFYYLIKFTCDKWYYQTLNNSKLYPLTIALIELLENKVKDNVWYSIKIEEVQ